MLGPEYAVWSENCRTFPTDSLGTLFTPQHKIVEIAAIVEGANAEITGSECLVVGRHQRLGHVVEINFDLAAVPGNFDVVPAVGPGRTLGLILGDHRPVGI